MQAPTATLVWRTAITSACPPQKPAGISRTSVEDYEALKARIASGEITVDNSSDDGVKPTVSEYTEVNYIQ